jgi:hypothetical protein
MPGTGFTSFTTVAPGILQSLRQAQEPFGKLLIKAVGGVRIHETVE